MQLEQFVSKMMTMSVYGRLWHWSTDVAQHHTTFEDFLNANEDLTDSVVESALGNNVKVNMEKVGVESALGGSYSIDKARDMLAEYRKDIFAFKGGLDEGSENYGQELVTILDDATELCSKTLYMLRLS